MNWPRQKLEALAAPVPYAFVGGPFGSKLTSRDYTEDGVPVIRGANMGCGRYLSLGDFVFVSEEKVRNDLSSNLAHPNDLVFTQRGTLGQVAIIPNSAEFDYYVVSQSQMKITVDDEKADILFLYYYFSNKLTVEKLISFASSSGVPHINLTVMRNFEVSVPPMEEQKRISSVLTTYDDLIENNRRRIALLEEAARLLYREWFVHFHFHGHEHVEIVDGVPLEWEIGSVFDFVDVLSGGTPKTKEPSYWNGGIPFYTPKDSTDNIYAFATEKTITEEGLAKCNSRLYPKDTLFITARGTVGNINLAQTPMAMNQSCYALIGKNDLPQKYLYFAIKERIRHMQSCAGGAVFDAIIVDTFKKIPFFKPPESLVSDFMDAVDPMISQIDTLLTQNRSLIDARDLLLPRLMDGRIQV